MHHRIERRQGRAIFHLFTERPETRLQLTPVLVLGIPAAQCRIEPVVRVLLQPREARSHLEQVVDGDTHLIGFGPDPELLDVNDTDAVQQAVRLFLPDAKVKRTLGYQWTLDPYAQGTWCTLRPHMWSRYLRELQQPTARIIFASADWANGFRGFIDGAIEQGMEAGRRIRALFA